VVQVLRTILLGPLCVIATAQSAISRHILARPFAVDAACSSRCTISRGEISCPRFLVTPNYPPGRYEYKMTLTACGRQLRRYFRCP
jgi:hypothetical protein